MAGFGGERRGVLVLTAVLAVGAGALTGCKADVADGPPVQISKMPQSVSTGAAPSADPDPPAPERSTPQAPEPHTASPSPAAEPPGTAPLTMGSEGERVRELQARLRQLGLFDRNPTGYYGSVTTASVERFQGQQGLPTTGTAAERTWAALTARTRPPTATELYPATSRPLDAPDPRCLTGRVLCISKESRTLAWMVDGEVRSAMDVRFGSDYTPTREGEFGVDFKSRDHHSTIYDTPMPYALFFSGGQAVHYSADFAANGYAGASHGCVNVRDKEKIAALFDQVRTGDKVVIYK